MKSRELFVKESMVKELDGGEKSSFLKLLVLVLLCFFWPHSRFSPRNEVENTTEH